MYAYGLQYTYTITNNLFLEAGAGQYFSGWTRRGKSDLSRIEDVTTNYVSGGQQNVENDLSPAADFAVLGQLSPFELVGVSHLQVRQRIYGRTLTRYRI